MQDELKGSAIALQPGLDCYHKGSCLIKTAGQWPWKLESAKKCVTTYLPN